MRKFKRIKDVSFGDLFRITGITTGGVIGVEGLFKNEFNGLENSLFLYGIGEIYNCFYDTFKDRLNNDTKNEEKTNYENKAIKQLAAGFKAFPILSPVISATTDGDFAKSVLLPIGVCVSGYLLDYAINIYEKRKGR